MFWKIGGGLLFWATLYARLVWAYSGAALCVFDVIKAIALSAQFVGRNTPAIYSLYFLLLHFQRPPVVPKPQRGTFPHCYLCTGGAPWGKQESDKNVLPITKVLTKTTNCTCWADPTRSNTPVILSHGQLWEHMFYPTLLLLFVVMHFLQMCTAFHACSCLPEFRLHKFQLVFILDINVG